MFSVSFNVYVFLLVVLRVCRLVYCCSKCTVIMFSTRLTPVCSHRGYTKTVVGSVAVYIFC